MALVRAPPPSPLPPPPSPISHIHPAAPNGINAQHTMGATQQTPILSCPYNKMHSNLYGLDALLDAHMN